MASEALHRLNTDADVTGHAHPSNMVYNVKSGSLYAPSLFGFVSKVKFHVILRGLLNEDLPAASACLFPAVRRSPSTIGGPQHLDTVSCWKGLSQSQSEELVAWEGLFKESMASQIKEDIQRGFALQLKLCPDAKNKMLLVPRMANFLEHHHSHVMKVSMTRLVHNMISLLYNDNRSETTPRSMEWSLSCQELPSFVYNFVRLHDCFIHTRNGPKVKFDISQSYTGGILTVFTKFHWQPPRVTFPGLPSWLLDGGTYRITPRFDNIGLSTDDYSAFRRFNYESTYTVTRSTLPLLWNHDQEWFEAPITYISEETNHGLHETILSANMVTHFHGGVRFEASSRYNIKVRAYEVKRVDSSSDNRDDIRRGLNEQDTPAWVDPVFAHLFPSGSEPPDHEPSNEQYYLGRISVPRLASPYSTARNVQSSGTVYRARRDSEDGPGCSEVAPLTPESKACSLPKRKIATSDSLAVDPSEPLASGKVQRPDAVVDSKRRKLGQRDYKDLTTKVAPSEQLFDGFDAFLRARLANHGSGSVDEALKSMKLRLPLKLKDADALQPYICRAAISLRDIIRDFLETRLASQDTGLMDEAQDSEILDLNNKKPRNDSAFSSPIRKSDALPKLKLVTPGPSNSECGSGSDDKSPASVGDRATTSTNPVMLMQEQIQRNYREFEEHQKRKATERAYYAATIPGFDGVVSPTDMNDKDMERIFLGDSDTGDD